MLVMPPIEMKLCPPKFFPPLVRVLGDSGFACRLPKEVRLCSVNANVASYCFLKFPYANTWG